MIRRLAAVPLVLVLVGTSAWALAGPVGGTGWIDAPLGSVPIVSSPVRVVAHLNHPGGVTGATLAVDGEVVAGISAGGSPLETVEFLWTPGTSGPHLLEVYGPSREGWIPGRVLVDVDLGTTTTTTTAPTTTTTARTTTTTARTTTTTVPPTTTTTTAPPTTTTTTAPPTTTTTVPTTTTTTCVVGAPSPTGPGATIATLSPTLTWAFSGCDPDLFEVEVSRDPGFLRLEWSGSVPGTDRSVSATVGADCITYYWRVRAVLARVPGPWSSTASFTVQQGRC